MIRFIFLLLLVSCNGDCCSHTDSIYTEKLSFFKDEFVNHFPRQINSVYTVKHTLTGRFGPTSLMLSEFVSSAYLDSLKNYYSQNHDKTYHSSDSCLLVVNKFTTKENEYKTRKASNKEKVDYLNKNCLEEKLPIPNFYDFENATDSTICKLTPGFIVYVLEAKSGVFWDDKYLVKTNYMPVEWEHGYSKGIALNEKTMEVIFWFILW